MESASMPGAITTQERDEPIAQDSEKLSPLPHTPTDPELGNAQQNGSTRSTKTPTTQVPAWNASHPCYPHVNPHVPLSSPLFKSTRVIRIPRNWMVAGDLYPAYSNVYPEILAPWIREVDFRRLVEGLNTRLALTFDPTGFRAWLDGALGCVTGWLWEDFGMTKAKSGMRDVERFIDAWNLERKTDAKIEDRDLVHCIQLRRTGFTCLDIVIPDPKVMVVNEAQAKQSQSPGQRKPDSPQSRKIEARV